MSRRLVCSDKARQSKQAKVLWGLGAQSEFNCTRNCGAVSHDQGNRIEVSHVFVKQGDFELNAESWRVENGGLVALVGANGAGKTTFLRILSGHLRASRGNVMFDGIPSVEFGWALSKLVGLVPDALIGLEDLSLSSHFAFLREIYTDWDESYALGLADRLEVPLKKPLRVLSRGNRVKAGFIMIEAARPPILLLDEPTSGLDPIVRQEVLAVLFELRQQRPERVVVFSTHILEDIVEVATGLSLVRRGIVYDTVGTSEMGDLGGVRSSERPQRIAGLWGLGGFS